MPEQARSARMPVLFVGHGSPMNAIADNTFTRALAQWGRLLPRPRAILCISAHWYVAGVYVLSDLSPETIHDFWGFPQELYNVEYPAPGHSQLASMTRELLDPVPARLTDEWGLDHGAWSVLLHLFPKADIPVYQVSLDYRKSPQDHYQLAKSLKPLREEGVLILGSGNLVHNLGRINWDRDVPAHPWAVEFDEAVKEALLKRQHYALIHYQTSFPGTAPLAVPTPDHYLPFLYALAVIDETDPMEFRFEGFEHGSISMRAVQWG